MMSALLALLVVSAGEVSVRVEVGAPCLDTHRLEGLLTAQGLRLGPAGLKVRAIGEGSGLRLEGSRGAERLNRTIPARVGQCTAVERVVVSLIVSWARPLTLDVPRSDASQPAELRDAGPDDLAVDAGPDARRDADDLFEATSPRSADALGPQARSSPRDAGARGLAGPEPARDRVPVSPATVAENDAGVRPLVRSVRQTIADPATATAGEETVAGTTRASVAATSPAILDGAGAQTTVSEAGRDGGTLASAGRDAGSVLADSPTARSWSVDASLLGGGSLGPTPELAPGGSVRLGFSPGRLGLVLDAALEAERSKEVAPGIAVMSRQWLGLSARVDFLPLEALRLDVTLGLRGLRLLLAGRGFPDAREVVKFDLAAALTAGARVHLVGPLWLEGRLHGSLRTRSDSLLLEDPATGARTTLFVVTPWDIGLSLGLHARY